MKVTVFGLGYVGCVSATCLADRGHTVIGVDVNPTKVDLVNRGRSPILEPGLAPLLSRVVASGHLRATANATEAVRDSDISLISVGTPSLSNGSIDLKHVITVAQQIGQVLLERDGYHVIALRSTVLPGTLIDKVLPLLAQESGKQPGIDFGLCSNPEFLREGSALEDYGNPPFTLVGALDDRSADVMKELYTDLSAPLIVTDLRTAEMVKYVNNAFHALKVTFANEIGLLCKAQQIDSHGVMDIFLSDTQLNISTKYLRPGFAFGGSCLPKDLRALVHRAKTRMPSGSSKKPERARSDFSGSASKVIPTIFEKARSCGWPSGSSEKVTNSRSSIAMFHYPVSWAQTRATSNRRFLIFPSSLCPRSSMWSSTPKRS
jgi:GDP-mannose 6-dehydrogenase